MKSQRRRIVLIAILLIFVLFTAVPYLMFRHSANLLFASLTRQLPYSHVLRIRNNLLDEERFLQMLAAHEKTALTKYQSHGTTTYTKKHLHRTRSAMIELPICYDIWETWVRTDIINGQPLTSFLVRLGIVPDKNAGNFFGKQLDKKIKGLGYIVRKLAAAYNWLFDRGILTPIRLNVTEADQTSSITHQRYGVKKAHWETMVKKMHGTGKGKTFLEKTCQRF